MQKTKKISELLSAGNGPLANLKAKQNARATVLEHVCAALPANLAESVASAGVEEGCLTIGVASAAWASRLRYVTDTLRMRVNSSMGIQIQTVRIRVVPSRS